MEREDYLKCYGANFNEQVAQDIKSKSISTVVLPGWIHYQRDPQYDHGPPDRDLSMETEGARLLMNALSSCSSVTSLDLSENSLSFENLSGILSSMSTNPGVIKELDLRGNEIDASGAREVAKFVVANKTSLQKLILANNQVGGEGALMIAEAVKVCRNLKLLNLRGNKITPEGVEAIMDVVGSSYSITSLDIGGNHTRSEGVAACARMLSTNPLISHLDMDGMMPDVTDVAHMTSLLTRVGESTALEHLSISNISKDQEKHLLWKSRFFGLPIVLISNYFDKITSAVLTHVGCNRMCNKFGLEVDRSAIPSKDFERSEYIEQYAGVHTNNGESMYYSSSPLRAINMLSSDERTAGPLTDAGIHDLITLVSTCSTLISIRVPDNNLRDSDVVKIVGSIPADRPVTLLDFHGNQITSEGAQAVASLMMTNKTITSLDLHGNKIDSEGAIAIADVVLGNAELKLINLEDNAIEQPGLQAFVKVIETCPKLTTLMLQHNDPSKSLVDVHVLESFLQAIKRSSSLTTVSLPNCSAIGELQQSWLVDLFGEGTTADWLPAVQKHMVSNALRNRVPYDPLSEEQIEEPKVQPPKPPRESVRALKKLW